jgi:hypothetical protein
VKRRQVFGTQIEFGRGRLQVESQLAAVAAPELDRSRGRQDIGPGL